MSSKHRVVVLKIVAGELTVTAAATEYGMSRQYLHKLLARYRDEGIGGGGLQTQLDTFREHYNTRRPHRARDGSTPAQAYAATPKAIPAGHTNTSHYRVRHDHVDTNGKISIRRAGRMHHLGVGITHRGKRVLVLADETTITVIHLDTGEILATNTIDPTKTYWRNQEREPGRWPSSRS